MVWADEQLLQDQKKLDHDARELMLRGANLISELHSNDSGPDHSPLVALITQLLVQLEREASEVDRMFTLRQNRGSMNELFPRNTF